MMSGGQKQHFLQDSVHIFKFCSLLDSAKNFEGAELQNPGGTEQVPQVKIELQFEDSFMSLGSVYCENSTKRQELGQVTKYETL